MTESTQNLLARLTGFTPGPWSAGLYETDGRQWDRGNTRVMRGEYFGRAVLAKQPFGAVALVPRCHADHDFDAALIEAAPDLHRIATEQAAEISRLRAALVECRDEIDDYIRHEYPNDDPIQVRRRQRDFAANPARAALEAKP